MDGAQPALKFLQQICVLDRRNLIDVERNFDSIDSIPGFEAVTRNEWDLYVNSLGPAAVKYSRDDSFDLTLFWKSKAENLPELYKLASCYCTTTIGSYDVERSFSAYSAILDEKRRSLDESTIKAFHFLNLNLRVQNSNKQEREQHRTTATCTTNRVTPNESSVPGKARSKSQEVTAPENPLPGEASEFPRLFNNQKKRSQHLQPVPETKDTGACAEGQKDRTENKRKKTDEPNFKQSKTAHKRKKRSDTLGAVYRSSLDTYLQVRKEANTETGSDVSAVNLQHTPAIGVIYGLNQSTAQKFDNQATCISQKHREPLLNCLLNVKFKGSSMIDKQDLENLYGCKSREEDNYLTNFVVEAYFQLIQTASLSKGLNVEILGWEAFEKGFGKKQIKDLLKGKGPLMNQNVVLVPCNPGNSKHWFLLAVLPKEKELLVLDSKAGSFSKPTTVNAISKMRKLLQQLDSSLHVNQWCFTTNTSMDIPQQGNNIDCGVFLCMFTRCFLLQSPVPYSKSIISVRRHIIVELHEQELQSFTEPSIQEGAYYAVEYQKTYYFGQALGCPDGSFINFKFLHSTSSIGAKVFDWPRRDDNDRVHSSCVFYGPYCGRWPFYLSTIE